MNASIGQRAFAEAVGVYFLVLAGCGAILVDQQTNALGHVGVAAVFGLVILAMVMATGHVSGAHLNPAVTLAFLSLRRIDLKSALLYGVAQFVGATTATLTLSFLFPAGNGVAFGATFPSGSNQQTVLLEAVLTAMLMFVIVSVATDARAQGHLARGRVH